MKIVQSVVCALILLACFQAAIAPLPAAPAEPAGYDPSRFEITPLATGITRPMELAVADDGRVFFIELDGFLKVIDQRTGKVDVIGELKVELEQENGLIGLALDPDFSQNNWIYLQYSPPDYPGQHISRFTLVDGKLDRASEKLLLKFTEQRKECCHHAGSMAFGPDGCLYIGTGDNTHPGGDSHGYAPLDEREDRAPFDAQKSAANSRSGSGKILRIRPTPEGGYEIPEGNLFPRDGSQGLPEIYIMGCRNPWRINVDSRNGMVYWGEVGPDAGGDGERGPRGYDEINQARAAGNFGWPYFIGNNFAYADVDFATGKVGEKYDPARPVNKSPNNTGIEVLPPAQPALLYYPYGKSTEFPELGEGGRTACAGPVYYFDPQRNSATAFPKHFDRTLFIFEWTRHWIKAVHLDDDYRVSKIEDFMPSQRFVRPTDMQFGPEGAMYLIEYGETWGVNKDARLVRIDYISGNRKPLARAEVKNNIGREPLEVTFSSAGTLDKDEDDTLSYQWRSYRADQPTAPPQVLSTEANPTITFREPGIFNVELVVTDSHGATGSAMVPVMVGNAAPTVKILAPTEHDFFDPAQPVRYQVHVVDTEDGTSDPDEADADDLEMLDGEAPTRVTMNVAIVANLPRDGAGEAAETDPPGLRLMKGSDCFNCHAIDQPRVGPPLLEVANKYRNQPHALADSVKRVREGSTGVWGKVPMIPHAQHDDEQLHAMVSWIYSLTADRGQRVYQGFVGEVPPATDDAAPAGHLLLEATYVDRGHNGIPALASTTKLFLRSRHVNAETADEIQGAGVLNSNTAHGGKFIGAINHGASLRFRKVPLDKVSALTLRVSSAGGGAHIEVRQGKPDGPLLASTEIKPNGHWEQWYDHRVELKREPGVHDVYLLFLNPSQRSGLMNIDSLVFEP